MKINDCACAVHVCAAGDAWGVPRGCLGGAWHGTNWGKCVKHTPFDQNMLPKFNQGYTQGMELS